MVLIPRDYQEHADQALWNFVHNQPTKNPVIILPTGTGKSLCISMFIYRMLAHYPHLRMMMCTHVKELIEGNYKTLLRLWPAAPAGIYSAGLGQKDVYAQVTSAGIQSVANRPGRFGRIDFLLIDEAHLVGTSDSAMYVRFIEELRKRNPHMIVIGFTATAFRMGLGSITEGGIFDSVAFDGGSGEAFVWFIDNGYLIKPIPIDPGFQLDSSAIHIDSGDFNTRETSAALAEQDILERAVNTTIQLGEEQGRQSWLTFCQSIDDAELVADMFRYKGYPVEAVHSKRGDRDDILEKLKRGELRGVTNRDILTTGFDHPPIDLISMLRLTRSPGLWVQMLGRGTRPVYINGYHGKMMGHNGGPPLEGEFDLDTREGRLASITASPKQTCLVLDFVGNTERLGPINYPTLPKRRGTGGGAPPVRKCPQCKAYNHPSLKFCDGCGYEFPPPERLKEHASSTELVLDLMNLPPPEPRKEEIFGVHRMIAMHNEGRGGKLDTLRVEYFCGLNRFSVWLCFEHAEGSFPRRKAEEWWKAHGGIGTAPTDISEAVEMAGDLNKPLFIKVWTNTKYPEILGYDHRGTRFELPPELGGPPLQVPEPDPMEVMREQAMKAREHMFTIGDEYFEEDIPF